MDKSFIYRDSAHTDVTVTWRKARDEMDKQKQERQQKVRQLRQIGVKDAKA